MDKIELKKIIKGLNVLFVDDEQFVVETMKEILPLIFNKTYFATNGYDGISTFKENDIDLVISDLSMPKINGIDMAKQIKEIKNDTKIIFISGHNENSYLEDANKLDAQFVIKPINSSELYQAIEKVL